MSCADELQISQNTLFLFLRTLFEQTLHPFAVFRHGFLIQVRKYLFKAGDLCLGNR